MYCCRGATSRIVYDLSHGDTRVATITREQHTIANPDLQFSFEYFDGLGQSIQKKVRAEKGDAWKVVAGVKTMVAGQDPRWVGSGALIRNNKNNPVKKYEEFFSTTHLNENDEALKQIGVTPIIHYDALGRVVKTVFPDKTFSRVEFTPWKQITFDQNDAVKGSSWYSDRIAPPPGMVVTPAELDAAQKASLHDNTPAVAHLDSLGRTFLTLTMSRQNQVQKFRAQIKFDSEGNQRQVIDPKGNVVMQYEYDMVGRTVKQTSMDAGTRIMLNDVAGKPFKLWDNKGQEFSYTYDAAQRPVETTVKVGNAAPLLFDKIQYGEGPGADAKNLKGTVAKHYDTAGIVENLEYDFKNNLLQTKRRVLTAFEADVDWNMINEATALTNEIFSTENKYDALNRLTHAVIQQNNKVRHVYNVAGLLEQVFTIAAGAAEIASVRSIDYNEKGQRSRIVYGNDTITHYTYDEKTFRLNALKTTNQNATKIYQDLHYTYDPIGNITRLEDKVSPVTYFNNMAVSPLHDYTYDALYQLTVATGREHIGQNVINESNSNKNYRNFPFNAVPLPAPGELAAMRPYTQLYTYDEASNILRLDHQVMGLGGYTRTYLYNNNDADRATFGVPAATPKNNQLLRTTLLGKNTDYTHDIHGNITSMPHLSLMDWNFKDQLKRTAKTVMADGNPATTHYVYDATGTRVRKITVPQNSALVRDERIYVGGFELYIKYKNNTSQVELKRQTLRVMDDQETVSLIETKTEDSGSNDTTSDRNYIRYQYSNNLGSVSLELDENSNMISYEEYHPYGTTSFQAINARWNPVAKRYRYTGLERDEENGFGYHNARYYVSWLGRWLNADPLFSSIGQSGDICMNLFESFNCNPIKNKDSDGMLPRGTNFYEDIHSNILEEITPRFNKALAAAEKAIPWNASKYNNSAGYFRWRGEVGARAHIDLQRWAKIRWPGVKTELVFKLEGTVLDLAFPKERLLLELKSSMSGVLNSAEQQAKQVGVAGEKNWAYGLIVGRENGNKGTSLYLGASATRKIAIKSGWIHPQASSERSSPSGSQNRRSRQSGAANLKLLGGLALSVSLLAVELAGSKNLKEAAGATVFFAATTIEPLVGIAAAENHEQVAFAYLSMVVVPAVCSAAPEVCAFGLGAAFVYSHREAIGTAVTHTEYGYGFATPFMIRGGHRALLRGPLDVQREMNRP